MGPAELNLVVRRHRPTGLENRVDIPAGSGSHRKPGKRGYRRLVRYTRWGRCWRALVPSRRLVVGLSAARFIALVTLVEVVYTLVKSPDLNALSPNHRDSV